MGTLAYIYEFGGSGREWMSRTLLDSLRRRIPDVRIEIVHGVFPVYRPGGYGLSRLLNLVAVYVRVAIYLLRKRADSVLVRSSPPGIQIWTLAWAQLHRIPVIFWLMDYHPEIEARLLDRCRLSWIARALRWIDGAAMRRSCAVIVLDNAMGDLVRARAPGRPIIVHPTWAEAKPGGRIASSRVPGSSPHRRRLVYGGNLGSAHSLITFMRVLTEAASGGLVDLHVIGCSVGGEARFRETAKSAGIDVNFHPRTSFGELVELFATLAADVGVILLSDAAAGLLSPSKFAAYLAAGLPTLYIGPAKTNSDMICQKFGAGLALRSNARSEDIAAAANWLWSAEALKLASQNVLAAAEHFEGLDAERLADALVPLLVGPVWRK